MKMRKMAILLNSLIIVISVILLIINDSYDETLLQCIIVLAVLSVLSFFMVTSKIEKLRGQWLRASYVFLIGYLVVFFQYNLDLVVHNTTVANSVFASTDSICTAALMSLIGLSSFVIGTNSCLLYSRESQVKYMGLISNKHLLIQKSLFVFFVVVYLYYNATNILFGRFEYSEDSMAESAGSFSNYSSVMILALSFTILSTNVYNARLSKIKLSVIKFFQMNGLMFNIPLLAYLSFVFMTGDRGPIITIVLAYAITCVIACDKKVHLLTLALVVVAGGTLLTIIGNVRRETHMLTLHELASYRDSRGVESVLPATLELAGSYNTFTYSVQKVPSAHDYFYGTMKLRDIGYSVPFLYRLMPFAYSDKGYENGTSSYCTYLIQGLNRTYGNGSSLLADIYIDFGVIGIVIIMFFLGKFIIRIDYNLFSGRSICSLMIGVVFFSFSIYWSRATLVTPLYYIVPSYIILYCRKFV